MTTAEDIGSRLVDFRKRRGITQLELGCRLGVPQQQVARWERDRYANVALRRVAKVADELGYPLAPAGEVLRAAEDSASYGEQPPVRDLGAVAARIRGEGNALRERFGLTKISVYGSFIEGRQREDSDVDLVVESDSPVRADEYSLMRHFGSLLGRDADVTYPDLLRWEIRDDVLAAAIGVWHA